MKQVIVVLDEMDLEYMMVMKDLVEMVIMHHCQWYSSIEMNVIFHSQYVMEDEIVEDV